MYGTARGQLTLAFSNPGFSDIEIRFSNVRA